MRDSIVPAVSSLFTEEIDLEFKKIANSFSINWPTSLEDRKRKKEAEGLTYTTMGRAKKTGARGT
jgi:hypothetical protein